MLMLANLTDNDLNFLALLLADDNLSNYDFAKRASMLKDTGFKLLAPQESGLGKAALVRTKLLELSPALATGKKLLPAINWMLVLWQKDLITVQLGYLMQFIAEGGSVTLLAQLGVNAAVFKAADEFGCTILYVALMRKRLDLANYLVTTHDANLFPLGKTELTLLKNSVLAVLRDGNNKQFMALVDQVWQQLGYKYSAGIVDGNLCHWFLVTSLLIRWEKWDEYQRIAPLFRKNEPAATFDVIARSNVSNRQQFIATAQVMSVIQDNPSQKKIDTMMTMIDVYELLGDLNASTGLLAELDQAIAQAASKLGIEHILRNLQVNGVMKVDGLYFPQEPKASELRAVQKIPRDLLSEVLLQHETKHGINTCMPEASVTAPAVAEFSGFVEANEANALVADGYLFRENFMRGNAMVHGVESHRLQGYLWTSALAKRTIAKRGLTPKSILAAAVNQEFHGVNYWGYLFDSVHYRTCLTFSDPQFINSFLLTTADPKLRYLRNLMIANFWRDVDGIRAYMSNNPVVQPLATYNDIVQVQAGAFRAFNIAETLLQTKQAANDGVTWLESAAVATPPVKQPLLELYTRVKANKNAVSPVRAAKNAVAAAVTVKGIMRLK